MHGHFCQAVSPVILSGQLSELSMFLQLHQLTHYLVPLTPYAQNISSITPADLATNLQLGDGVTATWTIRAVEEPQLFGRLAVVK
jgi:hypothetical protein